MISIDRGTFLGKILYIMQDIKYVENLVEDSKLAETK